METFYEELVKGSNSPFHRAQALRLRPSGETRTPISLEGALVAEAVTSSLSSRDHKVAR